MATKHLDIKEGKTNQILLCNTNRDIKNYLNGLKFRNNGNYKNQLVKMCPKITYMGIENKVLWLYV